MPHKSSKPTSMFSRATPSMMDRWIEQKDKLKKKFPSLTDNDLKYKEGKKGEMFEAIRIKLDIGIKEWKKVLKEL